MSQYEALSERFIKAAALERDHKTLLESIAASTVEKLAAYLRAPADRISVTPSGENGNPRRYGFRYVIEFGPKGAPEHTTEVPVVMTLSRHGLHAKVANGHDQHVGDPHHADWHEVFYDVLAILEMDCEARESKSRL